MRKKQGKRHTAEQIIKKLREADTMLAVGKTIAFSPTLRTSLRSARPSGTRKLKTPADRDLIGGGVVKSRQYLLSHLQYYHRL